jgi:hypothetical protein
MKTSHSKSLFPIFIIIVFLLDLHSFPLAYFSISKSTKINDTIKIHTGSGDMFIYLNNASTANLLAQVRKDKGVQFADNGGLFLINSSF